MDATALAVDKRAVFLRRQQAIEIFAAGATIKIIEAQTGINRHQLYWLLSRCLKEAEDGRILGFRGLLKYQRVNSYTRRMALSSASSATGTGFVGAFALLLERHPTLTTWLRQQIREHAVVLEQLSTESRLRTRLSGLVALHQNFLKQCRAVGLTAADYPLNTDRMGIRSLCAYIKAEMLHGFGAAARAAGAKRLKGLPRADGGENTKRNLKHA